MGTPTGQGGLVGVFGDCFFGWCVFRRLIGFWGFVLGVFLEYFCSRYFFTKHPGEFFGSFLGDVENPNRDHRYWVYFSFYTNKVFEVPGIFDPHPGVLLVVGVFFPGYSCALRHSVFLIFWFEGIKTTKPLKVFFGAFWGAMLNFC